MGITIQRGRQFLLGDVSAEVFDGQGKSGTFLAKAGEKLAAQQIAVELVDASGAKVPLKTTDDWAAFITNFASTKEATANFATTFGITFSDFLGIVDDAAASDQIGVTLNLNPFSELSTKLALDKVEDDYALTTPKGTAVFLGEVNGAVVDAVVPGTPVIGPAITNQQLQNSWQRNRTEQESWADFKLADGAQRTFRQNTGVAPFAKLHKPDWTHAEAMELVERFTLPVHLELSEPAPDGTVRFQDRDEMFRETYFDDRAGTLAKAGASVRARVRFDDEEPFPVRRVLIQAKEGRAIDGDASQVHKFERRFEGNTVSETRAQELLQNGLDSNGKTLEVAQLLYKLAQEKNTLPADLNLRLEPTHLVLQKRRRSHMQIDSRWDVEGRKTELDTRINALNAAGEAVPAAMQKYSDKLGRQITFLSEAEDLLAKYGQYMPSGEGFIISADRYSVYDPAARATPPNDVDDEVGRIGRGLHVESEWDTASSESFENAGENIRKQIALNPPNLPELQIDLERLEAIRAIIRADVQTTVDILKERLVKAGLEVDPAKLSKDERAAAFSAQPDRPVFWP
jgi:hypothetical protein